MEGGFTVKSNTREIMEDFIASFNEPHNVRKRRGQLEKPEVFDYEQKLGKQVFDMNAQELLDMIRTFKTNKSGTPTRFQVQTYASFASIWRALFDYYARNHKIILNPWNEKAMRGSRALEYLFQDRRPFSFAELQRSIDRVYEQCSVERGKYVECFAMMFYDGFATLPDLVSFNRDMINFPRREIRFENKTIQLSDDTFKLLNFNNAQTELISGRVTLAMTSWHDSYFKIAIRRSFAEDFQKVPANMIGSKISSSFSHMLKDDDGATIGYRTIYMLGRYDAMVKHFGKEETDAFIINAASSSIRADEFYSVLESYGADFKGNPSKFKQDMLQFVER